MKYRPEIDGLRALSVIPVVLFHAGFDMFSGGFVGVDIFFVISGYLITTIIISDAKIGEFSLGQFYENRARRILPALFFVILISLPFSWLLMIPSQLKDFSQSLSAASVFASNILFWHESGYFSASSELKPLLHTWSLSVEEQYYLIFPILTLIIYKFNKKYFLAAISILFLASFTASEIASHDLKSANFYLLPFRAWEILAGCLVALRILRVGVKQNNLLSLIGLALIILSIFIYNESTRFPSIYTLTPVLGAALVILFSGKKTIVQSFLSYPPLVGIGLISYSVYLWHQPVFAFSRIWFFYEVPPLTMFFLIVIVFMLSWLTWKFVETPFRSKEVRFPKSKKSVFLLTAGCSCVLFFAGAAGHFMKGFPNRLSPEALSLRHEVLDFVDTHPCHFQGKVEDHDAVSKCIKNPSVYLVGDSTASLISKQLRMALSQHDIALISFTKPACFPIAWLPEDAPGNKNGCFDFSTSVFDWISKNPRPVIFSARWRLHFTGARFDNGEGGVEEGNPHPQIYLTKNQNEENIINPEVSRFFERLNGIAPLIVVSQIPEAGWNVLNFAMRSALLQKQSDTLSTSYSLYKSENNLVQKFLAALPKNTKVFNAQDLVCSESDGRCLNIMDGVPLYVDDNHPAPLFSKMISERLIKENLDVFLNSKAFD